MKSECHNWADSLAACSWLRFPSSFFSLLFIPSIVVWTSQPIIIRLDNNIHFIEAQAKQNYCCVNLASGFKRITAQSSRTRAFFMLRRTFTIFFLPSPPSKLISNSSVFLLAWSAFFFFTFFRRGSMFYIYQMTPVCFFVISHFPPSFSPFCLVDPRSTVSYPPPNM